MNQNSYESLMDTLIKKNPYLDHSTSKRKRDNYFRQVNANDGYELTR